MKYLSAVLLSLTLCSAPAAALTKTPTGVTIPAGDKTVELELYGPDVVRVIKYPSADARPDKESFVIIAEPQAVKYGVKESDGKVTLTTNALKITVDPATATVTFTDKKDNTILAERQSSATMTPIPNGGYPTYAVSQTFLPADGEHIYGLGQHRHGLFNQRGSEQHLEQVNMEIAIPVIYSSKGYMLYWDNTSATKFKDNADGMTLASDAGDLVDYYLIYGRGADRSIALWRGLSGRAPMNPLWTFGFNQSRERYVSQQQLVDVVRRYRELGIPLDGIVQDWQYWGTDFENWNAVEWRNPEFPDPRRMIDEAHALNAHVMVSIWPSFGPWTAPHKELAANGLLLPSETFPQNKGVRAYDPFSPLAREIYWKHIKKNMFDIGMDSWWLDATEPEHGPVSPSDYDHMTACGTFRQVRNAYPLVTVGGVYDAQRAECSSKRVMILTRSAFAGQQRYGAHCWSGDIVAGWDVLRDQIPAALNFTLSGIPYWNSDIGAFYVNNNFPGNLANKEYHELYTRWMQFAAFTGMMRSHGTNCPREIFQFGQAGEPIYDAQAKAINLRYRLLPYIYSAAWGVTSRDESLMRPLFADFDTDKKTFDIDDQFIFGRSMLVVPVVERADSRKVYLPAGTDWVDFWSGKTLAGGRDITADAPIDLIPVYVRAGAIVPVGPDVQYAQERPWDRLQIRVYPGADGQFTLYEDSGDGYDYENGAFTTIDLRWDDKKGTLTIGPRKGAFDGMPASRSFDIALVDPSTACGLDNKSATKTVTYDGRTLKVKVRE